MGRPAEYQIISTNPLKIKELPNENNFSITNDIERIVEELVSKGLLDDNKTLTYIDSFGEESEVTVKNGKFVKWIR